MNELNEHQSYSKINPFTAIWLKTRETIRYVIEEKTIGYVIMLILLSGISSAFLGTFQSGEGFGMPTWAIIVGAVIISPFAVLIGVSIMSAIYLVVGKLFKGTATYTEMFKAVGTAMIPQIWLLPVVLIWIIVSPDTFFSQSGAGGFSGVLLTIVFSIILAIVSVWSIVIQSKAIGEAHRISSWKGFFTLLIPSVIIGIIVFAIVIFFVILIIGAASY